MTGGKMTINSDGGTGVGTLNMDYSGSSRMRLRALPGWLQLDALNTPIYLYASSTVAPVGAGTIGLGTTTSDYGWRDLILSNGSSYFKIVPNSSQGSTDLTWTLPDDAGSSGDVLTTNGSGTLSLSLIHI